jgi:hypothetical protein
MGWGQSRCAAGKAGRHGGHPSRWFSTCAAATPRLRRVFSRDDLRVVRDFGVGSGVEWSTPRAGVGRHNRGTGRCRGSTSQMARRVQRHGAGKATAVPPHCHSREGAKNCTSHGAPHFCFKKCRRAKCPRSRSRPRSTGEKGIRARNANCPAEGTMREFSMG